MASLNSCSSVSITNMGPFFFPQPHLSCIITLLFLFLRLFFSTCLGSQDERYAACSPFDCGNVKDITYPFWSNKLPDFCGHPKFMLDCQGDNATIGIMSQKFHVIHINSTTSTLQIARLDLWGNKCPNQYTDINLDYAFFNFTSHDQNTTLFYDCDLAPYSDPPVNFSCPIGSVPRQAIYVIGKNWGNISYYLGCKINMTVPVLKVAIQGFSENAGDVGNVLDQGFEVRWAFQDEALCEACKQSGGRCGYNASTEQFSCFCSDQAYAMGIICASPAPKQFDGVARTNGKRNKIIGVVAAGIGALSLSIAFFFYLRRKKNRYAASFMQPRSLAADPSLKDDPEKGSKYFGVHVFTYSELEEATNNFDSNRELGDGGFGTVYFGKLPDGRHVAVKRLYNNNYRRLEQFMNEVEILTRLRHQNLVSLYGCTSRHSRELLLVYEYIPNGTVADHLHGERAKPGTPTWDIRMNIALETASALAYLHASDIIHRDVKTNNILLDNHFVVKVADFGLSRLFPNDVTHISTAPQGTPGYLDPEYHQCYQLTDKSDVYSFGVVLIELISSMPAVDITRHRHEINLSNMAIKKIQNRALHELVDPSLGFESDDKVRKMINAVAELAFQCLQNLKDLRPSMEEVVERLQDIQNEGKSKTKAEEIDISAAEDVVLLKNESPPASPDSNVRSTSTTSNASG